MSSVVAPSAAALRFDGVSMVFPDGTAALDAVTLEIARGEIVAVVGPSGCGKSTLLRIASGLLAPTTGACVPADRNIGYVFQDPTLLPWRTVRRNVELFGELRGVPRAERRRRAEEAIALVGLDGFADRHPHQLSGGMRMRASLARSLMLRPGLFLFDEPFGALDEITRQRLNEELDRLFVEQRFAGLFITHSIYEAVYLADRVVVMSARPGRLVASFPVPFERPRREELRFEADFAALTGRVSHALRQAYR